MQAVTKPTYNINTPPLTKRTVSMFGWTIAGMALIMLADEFPNFAVGTSTVLLLGVMIFRVNQLQQLTQEFLNAIGQ